MTLQQHLVSTKSLLERRTHEGIARTRVGENTKVDREEEEVEENR